MLVIPNKAEIDKKYMELVICFDCVSCRIVRNILAYLNIKRLGFQRDMA